MKRSSAGATCLLTAMVVLAPAHVSATDSGPSALNDHCHDALATVHRHDVDASRIDDGIVSLDGWVVPFQERGWIAVHPTNPLLTQLFHSGAWLVPLTTDGIPQAVDLLVEQADERPDPGSGAGREPLIAAGWSEAQVTLRTIVVLCVYRAASPGDRERLLPVLDGLVAANLDPQRYYGPPVNRSHNHGIMANRALLDVARILQRPQLSRAAESRLALQLNGMYDACHLNREQSSAYQFVHVSLWRQMLWRISSPHLTSVIQAILAHLQRSGDALTFPDGTAPMVGDGSSPNLAAARSLASDADLMCPQTGWFSWRRTTDSWSQQVIARFGPPTMLHGHADKGEVLWWVGRRGVGHKVLVDRGLPGKNRDSDYAYATGPQGHSTLIWPGGSSGASTASRERGPRQTAVEIVAPRGPGVGTWRRHVVASTAGATLRIVDAISGPAGASPATANLPLDPAWRMTKKPGVLTTVDGYTLAIVCATSAGQPLTVRTQVVDDYQQEGARRAVTARCRVPRGEDGIVTTLEVT